MRSLFVIVSAGAVSLAAIIAAPAPASAETRSYTFNAFTRLDISAGYEVIFTQGPLRSVTIESDDFSRIIAEQQGDTLKISRPRNTQIHNRNHADVVRITAPSLLSAELNAGVDFRADSLNVEDLELDINAGVQARIERLKARHVRLDLNAGVDVTLSGECTGLTVDANAGVKLDADGLRCQSANVDAGVGATVSVHATDRAVADAALGAAIRIAGKPRDVEQHSSLGGSITLSR